MIFHGRVPEAMGVWGLRFRLNPLRWRRTRRKSKKLRRKTMAKTKPTPRRMLRRNPLRAPARGSGRTVIITTTPDDITADTADITTAGITASNLWGVYSCCTNNFDLVIKTPRARGGECLSRFVLARA